MTLVVCPFKVRLRWFGADLVKVQYLYHFLCYISIESLFYFLLCNRNMDVKLFYFQKLLIIIQ